MEQTFAPSAAAAGSARVSGSALARRVAAHLRRIAAYRASLRALGRLDPRLLADIGVTPADVRRELHEAGISL